MKKLTNILVAGTTAIVLSACGGSSGTSSLAEVDISQLNEGYSISGTYVGGHDATFEYCNNDVTMTTTEGIQEATFDINLNIVSMYFTTTRYLLAEEIEPYVFTLNGTYDTDGQGDFTITNISTIPCEVLP